ncbi:MAG TPA: ester cyclase [Candidatus Acidoferrales bacterium]|nr:ester cyclase [Candidatus Acidoferrales bacterium]
MSKRSASLCALTVALLLAVAGNADDRRLARNKAVARRVFTEILSQGKFEVAGEIYAQDFIVHGETRDGSLQEDQEAARGWKQAFPDGVMTVEQEVAEGDLVSVLWTGRGTNTGTGMGFPATGKKVQVRGITIWRITDGKIREEWGAFDRLSLMKQVGLLPAGTP